VRDVIRRFLALLGPLVSCCFWAAIAWAESLPELNYQQPEAYPLPGIGSLLLRFVISLAAVIVLAFLVIKFFQRKLFVFRSGSWIRVLDQVAVGPNKGLLLVEIAGKVYVLGVTEHNITRLLEINDPEEVAALLAEESSSVMGSFPRKHWLSFWEKNFQQVLLKKERSFDSKEGT